MGRVILARDLELDRDVAIKVLAARVREIPAAFKRFRREALLQARVDHPNVLRLLDWDLDGSEPYLVMEVVRGRELAEVVEEEGRLRGPELGRAARELGGALGALHSVGVLHRDLKPQNIMRREDGSLVVMDLGLAQASDMTVLTQTGAVVGTPRYFPPEVTVGGPWTAASDQFQVAAVLFFLATGRNLVPGETIDELLENLEAGLWVDFLPSDAVPPRVQAAILRGASRAPKDRFPSCEALGDAVASAFGREGPIEPQASAPIPAPRERASLVVRGLLVGLLGALGLLAMNWEEPGPGPLVEAASPTEVAHPFGEDFLVAAAAEVRALDGVRRRRGQLGRDPEGERLLETTPDPFLFPELLPFLPRAEAYLAWIAEGNEPEGLPDATRSALQELDLDLRGRGFPGAYHPGVGPGPAAPVSLIATDLWTDAYPRPGQLRGWMARWVLALREVRRLQGILRQDLVVWNAGGASAFPGEAVVESHPVFFRARALAQERLPWNDLARILREPGARAATSRWMRDLAEASRVVLYAAGRATRGGEPGAEAIPQVLADSGALLQMAWGSGAIGLPLEVILGGPLDTPAARLLAAAALDAFGGLNRQARVRAGHEAESLGRWEGVMDEAPAGSAGARSRGLALRGIFRLLLRLYDREAQVPAAWERYRATVEELPPPQRVRVMVQLARLVDERDRWSSAGVENVRDVYRDLERMLAALPEPGTPFEEGCAAQVAKVLAEAASDL